MSWLDEAVEGSRHSNTGPDVVSAESRSAILTRTDEGVQAGAPHQVVQQCTLAGALRAHDGHHGVPHAAALHASVLHKLVHALCVERAISAHDLQHLAASCAIHGVLSGLLQSEGRAWPF